MAAPSIQDELKLRKYEKTRKVFVRTSFIGAGLLFFMLFSLTASFFGWGFFGSSHHSSNNHNQLVIIIVFLIPIFYFIGMCDYLPKGQKPKKILWVLIASYVVLLVGTCIVALILSLIGL